MTVSNDEYLERIREYYIEFGKSPTSKISWARTVKTRFGGWSNALSLAGVPLNQIASKKEEHECPNCHKPTTNPVFCSRSCSATVTNKTNPRRKKKRRVCLSCGSDNVSRYGRYCLDCLLPDMTLDEATYKLHHRSSAYALVRTRARAITKGQGRSTCEKCGYSRHTETCHIKPISSFGQETMMSVVNAKDNLIVLCPNCHWEFDNPTSTPDRE